MQIQASEANFLITADSGKPVNLRYISLSFRADWSSTVDSQRPAGKEPSVTKRSDASGERAQHGVFSF